MQDLRPQRGSRLSDYDIFNTIQMDHTKIIKYIQRISMANQMKYPSPQTRLR